MLEVAFCVACATAGCDGAAMSAAATRPTARVRASAAALKLALLFILLTPNRNHGSRTAAVDADDRPLGDRKSVVEGKSVSVRVDLGGRRIIKKKKKRNDVCYVLSSRVTTHNHIND